MAWVQWCDTATATTTNSTAIWPIWCNGTGSTATTITTTAGTIWINWCDQTTTNQIVGAQMAQQYQPTAEQLAALEAQREAATARYAEEKKLREEAEARAEALLIENLSLKQRADYAEHKHFVVQRDDRRYRIRRGRMGNVDVVGRDGRITHGLCAHPGEAVPDCDTMLAQKLMLEADDAAFVRIANRREPSESRAVLSALH